MAQFFQMCIRDRTKAELEKAKRNIITFLDSNNSRYYMMLNHDNKYFTLFTYENDVNKTGRCINIIITNIITVSYTHLDVYKRQY